MLKSMFAPQLLKLFAALLLGNAIATAAVAAPSFDVGELAELRAQASWQKYAHVLIGLDVDNSIAALSKRKSLAATDYDTELAEVLSQITGDYSEKTIWKSVFGQVSFYVNRAGLAKLTNATGVKKIMKASPTGHVYDSGGSLEVVKALILESGRALVTVIPHSTSAEWSLGADGRAKFKAGSAVSKASELESEDFVASLSPSAFTSYELPSKKSGGDRNDPSIILNLTIEGYYELVTRSDIRTLQSTERALKAQASKPVLDQGALDEAKRVGNAMVTIDLKRPAGYTPLLHLLSPQARASQIGPLRAAFEEIVGAAQASALPSLQTIEGLASATVVLDYEGLKSLYDLTDARIERVTKPFQSNAR